MEKSKYLESGLESFLFLESCYFDSSPFLGICAFCKSKNSRALLKLFVELLVASRQNIVLVKPGEKSVVKS